jgi:hypothetical protein
VEDSQPIKCDADIFHTPPRLQSSSVSTLWLACCLQRDLDSSASCTSISSSFPSCTGSGWFLTQNHPLLKTESQSMTASKLASTSRCALPLHSIISRFSAYTHCLVGDGCSTKCICRHGMCCSCVLTVAHLQLGQPPQNTKNLQLCDSQDVRKPFNPLQLDIDCWHRCSATDQVSEQVFEWVWGIITGVKEELEKTINILWSDICSHLTCEPVAVSGLDSGMTMQSPWCIALWRWQISLHG